jgi:GPH family glycoside/pentoside/hexuronide:cation symporter
VTGRAHAVAVASAPGAPGRTTDAGLAAGDWRHGLRYGALALPLAFVALPLYVQLPDHYASRLGVPLAALGAVLLGARLLDALTDPWIGRGVDRVLDGSPRRLGIAALLAALLLAGGFVALFLPPAAALRAGYGEAGLLVWCAAGLTLTSFGYSLLSVAHQAWGARLGGDELQRARVVAWREGLALAGVLLAAVLPALAGFAATAAVLAAGLVAGLAALSRAPRPVGAAGARAAAPVAWAAPWRQPAFRRLMAVFLLNGIAGAVPATLLLFFLRDRLQAEAWAPLCLLVYFAAGAASMPLWLRLVAWQGLARAWRFGMGLAVAGFAGAALLGPGDVGWFVAVCGASGLALGADLVLPGAMLAGVVRQAGHGGRLEGAYFGWWNLATKLNLALAAGLALPLLAALGYSPGAREPQALAALTWAYAVLPCLLKLAAAALLTWQDRSALAARTPMAARPDGATGRGP